MSTLKEQTNTVSLRDWLYNLWNTPEPSRRRPRDVDSTQDYESPPSRYTSVGPIQLRFGVVTDTGTVREHNEDNFYVPGRASAGESNGQAEGDIGPEGLFLVADGMGGQNAGEKASLMAIQDVPRELAKRLGPEADDKAVQRAVRESVAHANDEILAQSHLDHGMTNMGTTVVLALFRQGRAYVAGIGDSRAYRLRGGQIEQLTKDHSLAEALFDAGTIRADEVRNHKFNHVLYLYLGSRDARDGPEEVKVLDLRPGDQFLLASDGLTGVVSNEMIVEVLTSCPDPQQAAQALVRRALQNKSTDNITCVVVHVV